MNLLWIIFSIVLIAFYLLVGVAIVTIGWAIYGDVFADSYNRKEHSLWYFACRALERHHPVIFRLLTVLLWPVVVGIGVVSVVVLDAPLALIRIIAGESS